MKIGIDLGSTYSGFARYDDVHGRVESVTIREGDPLSIPSVVFIGSKGKTFTGQAAKPKVKLGRRYEYFKMLLNEKHEDIILSRGYDSEITPKKIPAFSLKAILKLFLSHLMILRSRICIFVFLRYGLAV